MASMKSPPSLIAKNVGKRVIILIGTELQGRAS